MARDRRIVRGQSITEYVIVAGLVALAVMTMQTFVKRGIQSAVKTSTDDLLRIADDDVSGEATQRRAMPRAVEQIYADSTTIWQQPQSVIAGDRAGQTSDVPTSVIRDSQERYLELEGPPRTGGGSNGF